MRLPALLIALLLTGCAVAPAPVPRGPVQALAAGGPPTPEVAVENFITVVERVEPVAEQVCRQGRLPLNCDYQIVVDDDPRKPPNAFQTVGRSGRPFIVFTIGLIAEARNQHELAFVLGHEAAHHIAGHLPRQRENAARGAELLAQRAIAGGSSEAGVRLAKAVGAQVGARVFSKEFELEADRLGTLIALRAGYDPARGVAYFTRTQDPGNVFLGSHPPNAERIALVRRTAAQLR